MQRNLHADTELFMKSFWNKNAKKKLQFLMNHFYPELHTTTFPWTSSRDLSNVQ